MHLFHFLMGLFWLAVIAVVIFLYVLFPYVLFLLFRSYRTLRRKHSKFWNFGMFPDFGKSLWKSLRPSKEGDAAWPPPFAGAKERRVIRVLAVFVGCACLTVYVSQRIQWMGKANAHLKAKEYFVSGQVLNGFRHFMSIGYHPEKPPMWPLNNLQERIYRQGTRHLPADDGEIAVWQTMWFHSHYYKQNRRQLRLDSGESSPWMRRLLDHWWFCLETMATRPYADKKMMEEQYLRIFPALAFSYMMNDGFYTHKLVASSQRLAMMPEHVERYRKLSAWLRELSEKWQTSPVAQRFNATHPKVVALSQLDEMMVLESLIQGEIHERKFDCGNASIQRYIAVRQEFVQPAEGLPAYRRIREGEQGKRIYDIAIDATKPRSTKYILNEYCGVEVAGKENNNIGEYISKAQNDHCTPDEAARKSARLNYYEEDQILKEKYHGN